MRNFELLGIVCALNEYGSMLFGATFNVYNVHLDLTPISIHNRMGWRVMLEEK
jgi:hypothetical protein